ncbi:unnamed protein product [Amoebophrya sp. A25]|nr:unnamed protein product [Amoebophrya sp. A25]|eukprot:GSA25T00012398001.1
MFSNLPSNSPQTKKSVPATRRGITLWHLATLGDSEGLLSRINETGEPVDLSEPGTERTSLWIAASEGHLDTVKLLVALGADPQKVCEGRSVVDIARARSQPHVVYYLKCQKDYFESLHRKSSISFKARKVALLIGNTHYETLEHVPYAKSDVAVVARRLAAMKFETFVRTNLSTVAMSDLVDRFLEPLQVADTVLFYFAGLGCRQAHRSLLFGVDRKFNLVPEEEKLSVESIVEALLTRSGQKRKREVNFKPDRARRQQIAKERGASVIILDACRSVQKTGYREVDASTFGSTEIGFFDEGITPGKQLKGHGIGIPKGTHTGVPTTALDQTGLMTTSYNTASSSSRPELSGRAKSLLSQRQHLLTTMNNRSVPSGELYDRALANTTATHMRRPYTRKELAYIQAHGQEALDRLRSMGATNATEPFPQSGAQKSFPSKCGPQLGAIPTKHLAHYPGNREHVLDQEGLWADLAERKNSSTAAGNKSSGPMPFDSRMGSGQNFYASSGQHNIADITRNKDVGAFIAGGGGHAEAVAGGAEASTMRVRIPEHGDGGGSFAASEQGFVQQADPTSLNYNPRYGIGREDILEERQERHMRSTELLPDLGATSDGYNLMMQSGGSWRPASAKHEEQEEVELGFGTSKPVKSSARNIGGSGDDREGQHNKPDVSNFPVFQTLNPTKARNEEQRIEDQDFAFKLLEDKEKNAEAVPCTWMKQSDAQISTILRTEFGASARLGVLEADAGGAFPDFAEDARYATTTGTGIGTTTGGPLSATGGSMMLRKTGASTFTGAFRSCTSFRNRVTGLEVNKRGVEQGMFYGRFNGPTSDEYEFADKYCVNAVQPVDRIFSPGLHIQDIASEEKIAILYSHTPTEICDEDIPYDAGMIPRSAMFGHYTEDLLTQPGARRLFEFGTRNPISRRLVMEIQDAPFPGAIGWDGNSSGYSNMQEYKSQRPSLFAHAVEQGFMAHYKLRDALKSVSVKVMSASNRVQKPCMQERTLDVCL